MALYYHPSTYKNQVGISVFDSIIAYRDSYLPVVNIMRKILLREIEDTLSVCRYNLN